MICKAWAFSLVGTILQLWLGGFSQINSGTYYLLIVTGPQSLFCVPQSLFCVWVHGKKTGKCFFTDSFWYWLDPLQEEAWHGLISLGRTRCRGTRTRCFRLNKGCWSKILFKFFKSDQKGTKLSCELCVFQEIWMTVGRKIPYQIS